MLSFYAPVTLEGSRSQNMRVTVPRAVVQALAVKGFRAPGWVRFSGAGGQPFFTWARRPPSRASVDVGLPARLFSKDLARTVISCSIENAEPYRARPWTDKEGFDWLPLVDARYFPTETLDGRLVLHNQYEEPFVMRRVTDLGSTYRLLGWYQAEGSKSAQATDFSFATSNPEPLRFYAEQLGLWSVEKNRLALEVLREEKQPASEARAIYEDIGVEIVAERVRTGRGGNAAVLHVKKSTPLLRLVRAALTQVFKCEWPNKEAAVQYALGWLDGDGTITRTGPTTVELRLAGLEDEHRVTKHALQNAFGWEQKGSGYIDNKQGTRITLAALNMLQLLDAGAFKFSMSYVRLLLAFDERTRGLREGQTTGGYVRWGLLRSGGALTPLGATVCDGHEKWRSEIEKARQLRATAPLLFGVKGVANPL